MIIKRRFKLPGVHELNKDQDKILRLPAEGKYLILGPPGTGKSIIALLRALQLAKSQKTEFLVYNRTLEEYVCQLTDLNLNSSTWLSWYYKKIKKIFDEVPQIEDYCPDFETILNHLVDMELNKKKKNEYLIIDEGQDMPPEFYESLTEMGYENIFVTADPNQQLYKNNSNKSDLITNLDLIDKTDHIIELKLNYRNSLEINNLAAYFHTYSNADPPQIDIQKKRTHKLPILYIYKNFNKLINNILYKAENNPNWLIGIITPNDRVRRQYYEKLIYLNKRRNIPIPNINTYKYDNTSPRVNIDFSKGGIVVLNYKSVKGLEFETVFLADINEHIVASDEMDLIRKRFYVMVSRAINEVIMLKKANEDTIIDTILPGNDLLNRIEEN